MPKIIRRQPFSVSTNSNDYSKEQVFTQVNFKGMCDGKNDVAIDADTFARSENAYIDESGLLTSRAPFKKYRDDAQLVNEWTFGEYTICLHRVVADIADVPITFPDEDTPFESIYHTFILRCSSHDTADVANKNIYGVYAWRIPAMKLNPLQMPKVTAVQIEDKIFFWFGGVSLIAFNTVGYTMNGVTRPFFENAQRYLYIPIKELYVNGFNSPYEDANFLTDSYKRRYQYSQISSVNFESLIGKLLEVNISTPSAINESQYLYDIVVQKNHEKALFHPYSVVGEDYHIEVLSTPRATITMRYGLRSKSVEVSFDGRYFRSLPFLDGILGVPQLTKDGLCIIAFTEYKLMKCKLVAQESSDFVENNVIEWESFAYLQNAVYDNKSVNIQKIDPTFTPKGYFQTADQFAYVVRLSDALGQTGKSVLTYAEWLREGDVYSGYHILQRFTDANQLEPDNFNLAFKYISADLNENTGAIVSAVTPMHETEEGNFAPFGSIISVAFQGVPRVKPREHLCSGDKIWFKTNAGEYSVYIYKLTADLKDIENESIFINSGDDVIVMFEPENTLWQDSIVRDEIRYVRNSTKKEQYLTEYPQYRYNLTRTDGAVGTPISFGDQVLCTSSNVNIKYTGRDIARLYGVTDETVLSTFFVYVANDGDGIVISPNEINRLIRQTGGDSHEEEIEPFMVSNTKVIWHTSDRILLESQGMPTFVKTSGKRMAIYASSPTLSGNSISYTLRVAFVAESKSSSKPSDYLLELTMLNGTIASRRIVFQRDEQSEWFMFDENGIDLMTEKYAYLSGELIELPDCIRGDADIISGQLKNNYRANIEYESPEYESLGVENRYVHLLKNPIELSDDIISSGSLISFADGNTDSDYLKYDPAFGNRWRIEKIQPATGYWETIDGEIMCGDLVRLKAYEEEFTIPAGTSGNIVDVSVAPMVYPNPPADWETGDDWPASWPWPPPLTIESGTKLVARWEAGDALPIGRPIELYGYITAKRDTRPISMNDGAWLITNGELWTSTIDSNTIVNLDEYVNCNDRVGILNEEIPEHFCTLDEHYFSFEGEDGKNSVQITATRHRGDIVSNNDFLLYLPISNGQVFPQKITNLFPLSENTVGIFTENSIWYISNRLSEGMLLRGKPIKSKIPVGCRDGDEIVVAFDGQTLILPTNRGIAVMRPELLMADTEQTLTYLTQNIAEKYDEFYAEPVRSVSLINDTGVRNYLPQIKICTYKHWILFYKYMDREILLFDTRNSSWWPLKVQYPILRLLSKKIDSDVRLTMISQIDFSPINNGKITVMATRNTLRGHQFLFADKETKISYDDESFPTMEENSIEYADDVFVDTITGEFEYKYENQFVEPRLLVQFADPRINWCFLSQKLYFGQLNHFKRIKNLMLNLKGIDAIVAKLSTKVFRDFYHPERSDTIEMSVREVGLFTKYLNLMHVSNFQYKLENNSRANPSRLRINSIGIKYEVKEKIR